MVANIPTPQSMAIDQPVSGGRLTGNIVNYT
jgi:hypothetical protein